MDEDWIERRKADERRRFFRLAGIGTVVAALGGWYLLGDDEATERARAQKLPDGRPRLPPGQKVITGLKPMGGSRGSSSKSDYRLRVFGAVDAPFELDFAELLSLRQQSLALDVHCVTGWSHLGGSWQGVAISDLAELARVRRSARHVILHAAHGYTANLSLKDALAPDSLVAHRFEGSSLASRNGGPARALIPQLYFWKSAKWLTGIEFSDEDVPGYWEVRGYHNHADPWREQRYG